jgi:flavin-dependent dehydrogenase
MHDSGPEFDLAVVGGGPAGVAAAITAARFGAKVVLLEADEFPRHKVCGEFISAESLNVLRDLLQFAPNSGEMLSAAPVIDHVRFLLGRRQLRAPVTPAGISIARYDLDRLLWQAAQHAGVQTECNCDVRATNGRGPFQLETSGGALRSKSVIIAAGRWSRFRPRVPVPDGPKWIGLKAHFHEHLPPSSTDLYFFEDGYCGVQAVGREVVNACAVVRSDRAKSLEEVFALHPALEERSRDWQSVMEPVTTAPLVYREPEPARDNLIFVGDAAAFIDPFVGDGISIALRTGCLASNELRRVVAGDGSLISAVAGYKKKYDEEFEPLVAAASRIRILLSLPRPMQAAILELLRVPGLIPYMIRRTRHAG